MEFFASLFSKKPSKELMKPVVDPDTIVEPVDFFGPDFPYEQGFQEIDAYIRTLPEKGYVPVSDLLRLQFYALYKQATLGDIDEKVKQPSMLRDWEGYWKVVGWRKCKGMPREKARDFYIELFDAQVRRYSKVKWGATIAADRWAAFYDGVQRIQNLPKNGYHISDELRAHVYAMFKQATVGDLKTFQKSELARTEKKYKWLRSRPTKAGFDQLRYDEWKKLEGLGSEYVKRLYCKELFREAASYGYVWDPPGTESHLEVIGDQTSAKTFKKMDEEMLKQRLWIENLSDDPTVLVDYIDGAGVKLSAVERSALKKFLLKESKELEKRADSPFKTTTSTKAVAAEVLEIYTPERAEMDSTVSELYADLNAVIAESAAATEKTAVESGKVVEDKENCESSAAEEAQSPTKAETKATAPAAPAAAAKKDTDESSAAASAKETKKPQATKAEQTSKAPSAKKGEVASKKNAPAKEGKKAN